MKVALRRGGFTLTEIVLALAIIATVFVAILGLLPAGLEASRQAANSTVVGAIFEDVRQRLVQQPLKTGLLAFSPAFYDDRGVFISGNDPSEKARRYYRAEVRIAEWRVAPANTSALRPVVAELSWPVVPETGAPLGPENPRAVVTFPVTTLTGPDWAQIYPPGRADLQYRAKIEF